MLLSGKFDLDGRLDREDFQVGYVGGDDVLQREGRDVVNAGLTRRRRDGHVVRRDDYAVAPGRYLVLENLIAYAFDVAPDREERTVDADRNLDVRRVDILRLALSTFLI